MSRKLDNQISQLYRELNESAEELKHLEQFSNEILAAISSYFDVVYVTNGEGKTLKVSPACEKIWGYKKDYFVGNYVFQLERDRVFYPSVTRIILENKMKTETFQETRTGRRLFVVGTPIFNKADQIDKVINFSKDITETKSLVTEKQRIQDMNKRYLDEFLHRAEQCNNYWISNNLIYKSEKIENLINYVKKAAQVDSTVLVLGETGVGKEVFAELIHRESVRSNKPFVKINCGEIPENLIESEIFGYLEGSFTGAKKGGKIGLIESANGGTVFLDEIGELPFSMQHKLLRVLQEKEIRRIGSVSPQKVDVRFIAATNKDLREMIKQGKFREDLFFRLNVFQIMIPPLRERKEDIKELVYHFRNKLNNQYGYQKVFSHDTIAHLSQYHWPGNIRELENVVEQLIVTIDENLIKPNHLPRYLCSPVLNSRITFDGEIMPLDQAKMQLEKELVNLAYEKYKTTVKVAKVLGIDQSTASRKMKKHLNI